jgi:hypothetical protein
MVLIWGLTVRKKRTQAHCLVVIPGFFGDSRLDRLCHEFQFTGGNPRTINNAAVACLMGATSKRQLWIDEELCRAVASELILH